MAKPVVAIVGRPNVGKSTLFNRLIGQRVAIVEDRPGITRDRLQQEVEWRGRRFLLVDTGGLTYDGDHLGEQVRRQAREAMRQADLLLFLVDGRQGVTAEDEEVADLLRRSRRPVLLVANKLDHPEAEAAATEFFRLGLGEPLPVSALHGRGTGDLLDRVLTMLTHPTAPPEEERIRVAVVGRPNVGKSSLVNRLLGKERVIVSEIPGTTRDAIDVELSYGGRHFVLVDTAGIRRQSRLASGTEFYSVRRALAAMLKAQVVLLVLEAPAGVTAQDKRLAARVAAASKAMVIVVNKWDLLAPDERKHLAASLVRELAYVSWAPHVFVSALTGRRVLEVLNLAGEAFAAAGRRIATAELNRLFVAATTLTPPPQRGRKPAKFYYAAQVGVYPPTFVLFVSQVEAWSAAYLRYLENRLREAYDFQGTPVRFLLREKSGRQEKGGGA
ncbi:MAG: ribosome biogenesis GTPase Der [Clostridia bacterium]|nr:ribosome biogenesis GTPase Der [Clostridia bacterium]